MKFAAVFMALTGLLLMPVWGAPPAEACENCPCQGQGSGQMSQVMQALTGAGGPSQTARPMVKSNGALTMVSKLAQAVTQRFGASDMFGINTPIYWR